jgi:predicted outer membrane repeat protein
VWSWNDRSWWGGAISAAMLVPVLGNAAVAAVIHVPDDYGTIQQAINAASSGDEIIVAPGTYVEQVNLLGLTIWLHSSDGPDVTIIDGNGAEHVVTIESGEGPDAIIEGFTIRGGNSTGNGGGLYTNADIVIDTCVFTENDALCGGGLYLDGCAAEVRDCTFENNVALASGGGVTNLGGDPTFTGCAFLSNDANRGGAMANLTSSPEIAGCLFDSNVVIERGGAIYNIGDAPPEQGQSNPVITDCDFVANFVQYGGAGAAIANDARELGGEFGPGSDPIITGCLFIQNFIHTGRGGATWSAHSSNPVLEDCLFVHNEAFMGWGGALYNETASQPTLDGCQFIGNEAGYGGAVHSANNSGGHFTACAFDNNRATHYDGGAIFDANSSSTFSMCTFDNNRGALGGAACVLDESSTAFDSCSFNSNRADVRGGAIASVDGAPLVTDSSFIQNHAFVDGGAILLQGVNPSGVPTVSGSTFIGNFSEEDSGAVHVDAAEAIITTSTFEHNITDIYGGAIGFVSGATGTLTDLSFTCNTSSGQGGAMNIDQSEVALTRCTFTGNYATGHGGAIYSHLDSSTLLDCRFIDNSAGAWGGALLDEEGSLSVLNSEFRENSAGYYGGAIYASGANVSVTNVLLTGNLASSGGAMDLMDSGSSTLTNVTFADNISCGDVNGIVIVGGEHVIDNCVLWDVEFGYEIYVDGGASVAINHSNVRGGWPGLNIDVDPQFVDPVSGDYRLAPGSPCIDAGDCTRVPADDHDLDGDGDTEEPIPVDLDWLERFLDDPLTEDSGVGFPCVDMGAYEYQAEAPCPGDLDGNGMVDVTDLLALLGNFGGTGDGDINDDGVIDVSDLLILLGAWGPCE